MRNRIALAGLGVASVVGCGLLSAQTRLPQGARIDRLVVDKSEGRMWAYEGEDEVAVYRVAVGRGGMGPKQWEGDGRTPEGMYRIDERHRSADFYRFLHVSYPEAEDRERYDALEASGALPMENGRAVGIGGAIGIHGTGDGFFRRVFGRSLNRTQGCIMVSNEEAVALYASVVPRAVLEIRE